MGALLVTDCSLPQTLKPDQSYACKFSAAIPGDAAGVYKSTVHATGIDDDDSPATGTGELKVLVAQPLIVLTKTDLLFIDADRNFAVTPGDTIFYRITIRNDGNAAATGVSLADTLDPNTKLIPETIYTDAGTATMKDVDLVEIALGTLQVDQQVDVSFQVLFVPQEEIEQLENQAVLNFDDPLLGSSQRISVRSDDPDTQEVSDKTVTPVMSSVDANGIIFLPQINR